MEDEKWKISSDTIPEEINEEELENEEMEDLGHE